MAAWRGLMIPNTTRLMAACPNCQGELAVYVDTQAVDWANVPGGVELVIETTHHIGPHACYPHTSAAEIAAEAEEIDEDMADADITWRVS